MQRSSVETRQKAYVLLQARPATSLSPDGLNTTTFARQRFVLQFKSEKELIKGAISIDLNGTGSNKFPPVVSLRQ